MAALQFLVIHCSATPVGVDVKGTDIVRMHTASLEQGGRGWDRPGYAAFIRLDGQIEQLRTTNRNDQVEPGEITWGVGTRVNPIAHHICYAGGLSANRQPMDTRTPAQRLALHTLVKDYLSFAPNIRIAGHNQFANKACPSFWVPRWLEEVGVPEANIYRADPFGYAKLLG